MILRGELMHDVRLDVSTGGERLSDAQIAAEATRRLAWDVAVPESAVKVSVSNGHITLSGELDSDEQRVAALQDVTRLFGVTGVTDCMVVTQKPR
jgi:osmotically-inducible protein OsmY